MGTAGQHHEKAHLIWVVGEAKGTILLQAHDFRLDLDRGEQLAGNGQPALGRAAHGLGQSRAIVRIPHQGAVEETQIVPADDFRVGVAAGGIAVEKMHPGEEIPHGGSEYAFRNADGGMVSKDMVSRDGVSRNMTSRLGAECCGGFHVA